MRTIDDELKPVRHNIAVRSFFDRNKEAAEQDTKRIGMYAWRQCSGLLNSGGCEARSGDEGTKGGLDMDRRLCVCVFVCVYVYV